MGTSPTTGESFYSGDWEDIKNIARVLNIGDGLIALITQELVEYYQEMIDRDIDSQIDPLYHTPLLAIANTMPDGTEKLEFPGDVRRLARYWSAGLLLSNEFQQLDANTNDQVTSYIDDSRRSLFKITRYNHRIPGQRRKSHYSRTLPPNMQPPSIPEPDF